MVDSSPPLQKFVQQSLAKGMSKQALSSTLLKSGWPKELVSKYLSKDSVEPVAPSGKVILRMQGVSKSLGNRKVLDGLTLDIMEGEIFGIIGASGAGKTTLLNLIVGFLSPDSGDITIALPSGMQSIRTSPEKIKSFVGFSTQVPSFYPDLTVDENLIHFALMYGKSESQAKTAASSLARLVGLQDNRTMNGRNLSAGMQKRLDIACALVHDPKLLILDEPVAELDVLTLGKLWDMLTAINKQGTTIIIASHFLAELERVCHRLGIMRSLRIAEVGTPAELRVIYSRNYSIVVETASRSYDELAKAISRQGALQITKTQKEGQRLKIQTGQPSATLEAILQWSRQRKENIISVAMGRPSVRELFEALLK